MKVSGTAPHYKGLYQCVATTTLASETQLLAADNAFPEVWKTSGLVKTMVEVDTAYLRDGVDEVVELSRRGNRKEEKHRLGAEDGEHRCAPVEMELRVPALEEAHEPDDRQADVQRRIGEVEPVHEPPVRKHEALHLGLEVQPQPPDG